MPRSTRVQKTADQLLPPYGACAAQRGRGIRDGCGPLSRGIAGSRSAPHAPPSCDGARTATAAEIGAPSHRLQHPRGTTVVPTPPRPANTTRRAVVIAPGQKCRRRRAVPLSDVQKILNHAFFRRGCWQDSRPLPSGSGLCVQSRRDASSFSSFAATIPASNGPNDCLAISHLASRGRVTPSLVPRVGA